jgi:DNA-binding IclR family transcriptional regulator
LDRAVQYLPASRTEWVSAIATISKYRDPADEGGTVEIDISDARVGTADDGGEGIDAGRSVLGRIAAILDAFDGERQALTLGELSTAAGLPKSTVHRLVEQLRALGWVERDHNHVYRVGMRLFELGGLAMQRNQLLDAALPHLYALAGATNLTVQLGVLDRGEVVYLERITLGGYRLPTRLGGRMPAYCTGLGKAMLAFDPDATRDVLASRLERRTPHTLTDPDALSADLARIRDRGVAFDVAEAFDGIECVAAPIRNSGRAIGAVSVTGPAGTIEWDTVSNAVRAAAARTWAARFAPARAHPAHDDRRRMVNA